MEIFLSMIISGLAIGILVSAPMGPIGVLCIQRTLNKGRWSGFFTGLGAALSDMVYCLLTALGLSFVIDFIETNQNLLQMVGSVALMIYAVYLLRKNPAGSLKAPKQKKASFTQDFITASLPVSSPVNSSRIRLNSVSAKRRSPLGSVSRSGILSGAAADRYWRKS